MTDYASLVYHPSWMSEALTSMLTPHPLSAALFLACLACLTHPLTAHAETNVITAEATYTMGDGESPSFAEAQVLQRAKQTALEQAGTYVESYTKVHNYDLTTEEIQTLAGGVLEVEVLEKSRKLVGDGLRFSIKIKATVTTDKMEELARRIKGRNVAEEYQKLQAEYARLTREVETWKQLAAKAPGGPEREAALDQIRERERAYTLVQQNEVALFQRLVSGQALIAEASDARSQIDDLIEMIENHGHVIELGKITAYEEKSSMKWFPWGNWPLSSSDVTLTVPVTIAVSSRLLESLSETVHSLGGYTTKVRGLEVTYYVSYPYPRYRSRGISFRPSGNRHLDQYFYRKLGTIRLVMDFYSPGGKTDSCTILPIVNHILAASGGFLENRFDVGLRNDNNAEPVANTAILLLGEAKFSVELKLSKERAEQVDRVSARFEGKSDSPREDVLLDKCRIADLHLH